MRLRAAPEMPPMMAALSQATKRKRSIQESAPIILILLGAGMLRLAHLPYSHFQGDEIKALYPPGAAFPRFLLIEGKGPVQSLVTLLVRSITGGYAEWVTRLPFSLASLLAVYILYRLVRGAFGRSPALLSAGLLGSCGLLVALGRVVQYQSFCILFILLTAHFLFRWLRKDEPLLLYPGLLSYALGGLTHYDALAFAPSLGVILIAGFWQHRSRARSHLKHLSIAGLMGVVLVGLFYIPFMLHPIFPSEKAYLLRRIASGWGMKTFTSTQALLGLYLPPLYLAFTIPLLVFGVACVLRRRDLPGLIILFWFFSVFAFYMLLGGDPRSHVYNFFSPGVVLVAIGMEGVVGCARTRPIQRCLETGLWVLIIAFGCATYYMLVDHTVEHPWYGKTLFGYPLPNVEARRIDGVFGFPYQRGLPRVGELFRSGELRGSFDSNERGGMADYYFRSRRAIPPDYYIYVHRPSSLERHLPAYVARHYRWIGEVSIRGKKTIDIYESPFR